MVESFWAIPDATQLRTPLSILREQAAALTDQTKGVLVGSAEPHAYSQEELINRLLPPDGKLTLWLMVSVPALNDYRLRVLDYTQPVTLYPGLLRSIHTDTQQAIENQQSFIDGVKSILSSESVRNILTSLISQAGETHFHAHARI